MALQTKKQASSFMQAAIRNPTVRARLLKSSILMEKIPLLVRCSFTLLILTFPLEQVSFGGRSIAGIAGVAFVLSYLLYYNPLSKRGLPRIHSSVWCFLLYLVIFAMHGVFLHEALLLGFRARLLTLVQLLVLFWISSGLLQNERLRQQALVAYCIGAVLLNVGVILGLPGFDNAVDPDTGRVAPLGMNPNHLAVAFALAFVVLVGLFLDARSKSVAHKTVLLSLTLPLVLGIVQSGSRTAIAATIIGCSAYAMPGLAAKLGKQRRSTVFLLGIASIAAMVVAVAYNPAVLERWQQTYYEGDIAGRATIIPAAIEMIAEKPIFGWHPIEFSAELGFRVGRKGRDAHNLVLHLLLEVGMLGAIPFLIGLWLCFKAAWTARNGVTGLMPLAAFLTIMAGNIGITFLTRKPMWLALALTVAAANAAIATKMWSRILQTGCIPGNVIRARR